MFWVCCKAPSFLFVLNATHPRALFCNSFPPSHKLLYCFCICIYSKQEQKKLSFASIFPQWWYKLILKDTNCSAWSWKICISRFFCWIYNGCIVDRGGEQVGARTITGSPLDRGDQKKQGKRGGLHHTSFIKVFCICIMYLLFVCVLCRTRLFVWLQISWWVKVKTSTQVHNASFFLVHNECC